MTTPRQYTDAWHDARYQAAKAIGATARPIDSAADRADALQRATAEWVRLGLATEDEAWRICRSRSGRQCPLRMASDGRNRNEDQRW